MAEVTQLIHQYLRHDKKFPHVYCPGCGHGIVLGSLIRSVHGLDLDKSDVVLVAGIGCSGRMAVYVDFNTIHATHGRALTFATGIKMCDPELKVICVMGDGDALSIGGNHLIHAARRNIGLAVLILNNNIYGMTGGQVSPTTPLGDYSTTTPHGKMGQAFDIVNLASAAGSNFVARTTVMHAHQMDKMITKAISRPGFNLVEILTPCHTQYGRKNKFKTVVDMYRWYKTNTMALKAYEKLDPEKREGVVPTGVFVERDQPGMEEIYADMRAGLIREAE